MPARSSNRTPTARRGHRRRGALPPPAEWHLFPLSDDFPPGELERRTAVLCDPDDALAVIRMVARPEVDSTVCLLLDDRHARIAAVVVTGESGPPAAHALSELLEEVVLAAQPAVGAVVLASVPAVEAVSGRPPDELLRARWSHSGPLADAPCAWCELDVLDERLEEIGVELVEWFLVVGERAVGLRRAVGQASRWFGA
jgi:hypothetical protein